MKITGGLVYDLDKGFVRREVYCQSGYIVPEYEDDETFDANGCYVIPGLTDIHLHGCRGADFSDGDLDGLCTMGEYELSRGITQFCPTGMTLEEEPLAKACRTAEKYHKNPPMGADLAGVNLEGPFLSASKKGGQNGAWLKNPDYEMFSRLNDAAGGLVRFVTVAPELEGSMKFIRRAHGDCTVSLGHTAADYDTATEAFNNGACHVTHLFNAMPPFSHRAPGVVGAAFDRPGCMVEIICDGIHIHPSVVRAVFRLFGADRVVLVSDSMRAAGMPNGEYMLGGQEVSVKNYRATLPDGTLAGSATDLMRCLQKAVSFGVPLEHAVRAAAVNSAISAGIFEWAGSIQVGKKANIAVLNSDFTLKAVIFHGTLAANY